MMGTPISQAHQPMPFETKNVPKKAATAIEMPRSIPAQEFGEQTHVGTSPGVKPNNRWRNDPSAIFGLPRSINRQCRGATLECGALSAAFVFGTARTNWDFQ